MRLRLRGPAGASTITLGDDATVHDLRSAISDKTSLVKFDVRYSYPPKPLYLGQDSALLSTLDVCLDGEQLTITPNEDPTVRGSNKEDGRRTSTPQSTSFPVSVRGQQPTGSPSLAGVARIDKTEVPLDHKVKSVTPVSLQRKEQDEDVPELALTERGATLGTALSSSCLGNSILTKGTVMRVMPDDNSCLFRAFGTAVLTGDDLSMSDLRALVASTIQSEPNVYTEVVLEKKPDDYCQWIQTEQAWGGAIEMNIFSKHFDVEICSIDVQVSNLSGLVTSMTSFDCSSPCGLTDLTKAHL